MHSIALKKEWGLDKAKYFLSILVASWIIALFAQLRISVPFSLVPFTGQLLGVGLVGAFLGKRGGFFASLLYLIEGAFGFPVFSGGNGGILYLLGPVGGYLLSFPLFSYSVGMIREKWGEKSRRKITILVSIAALVSHGCGVLWLSFFIGLKQAALTGSIPFILFDAIKCFGIASYIKIWNNKDCGKH